MIKKMIAVVFANLFMLANAFALEQKVRHVIWDKTPIHITLPLNQERMIRFPLAISIVDSQLPENMGIMKIQDALYLSTPEPIVNKRLVVQLMPDGEVIVLSISANTDAADTTPVEIVMAKSGQMNNADEHKAGTTDEIRTSPKLNPVILTRFAIQSLFSPERLLVTPEGVSRTAMRTHKNVVMVYGASIIARPIISWQGEDLFITAVELRNALNKPVAIHPKQLIGNWQTASFYPGNTLGPRGSKDTTTVFVVSDKPFGEALADTSEFVR